jgi:hypothetical protein
VTAVGDPPRPAMGTRPALGQFFRAATTPAKLRLLLADPVLLCLIWGAVAAWVVSQRASGANDVVGTSEPLSLDGQQIYRALSDADATAAGAFLSGGLEPLAAHRRFLADIAQAASHLESATATAGHSPAARDLAMLSAGLPVYTGEVETVRADNRLGLPLGAAAYPVGGPMAVAVPYWTDCLVLLQQGDVAAISTDDSILAGLAAQDPWTKIVGPRFSSEPYGLAISQQHPDFVRFVNAVLQQLRTNGHWAASLPAGSVPRSRHPRQRITRADS